MYDLRVERFRGDLAANAHSAKQWRNSGRIRQQLC
jgi:hypothetical protein